MRENRLRLLGYVQQRPVRVLGIDKTIEKDMVMLYLTEETCLNKDKWENKKGFMCPIIWDKSFIVVVSIMTEQFMRNSSCLRGGSMSCMISNHTSQIVLLVAVLITFFL